MIEIDELLVSRSGWSGAPIQACEASQAEVEGYWPQLVQVWPAYQVLYERSGQ